MLKTLLDVLRGIVLNPVLTAFARGLAEAVAFLVLYTVMDNVAAGGALADEVGQLGPFILLGMRTLEGLVDKIDAAKQRQRDAVRDSDAPGYDFPRQT